MSFELFMLWGSLGTLVLFGFIIGGEDSGHYFKLSSHETLYDKVCEILGYILVGFICLIPGTIFGSLYLVFKGFFSLLKVVCDKVESRMKRRKTVDELYRMTKRNPQNFDTSG